MNIKLNIGIRWLTRQDLDEILAIETSSFARLRMPPWKEEDFIQAIGRKDTIGLVAESEGILGYVIYQLHKGHIHITNMAVDLTHRRQGVGTALVTKLKKKLVKGRREAIMSVLSEYNLEGHLFLQSQGFRAVVVLQDYYHEYNFPGAAYSFRYAIT